MAIRAPDGANIVFYSKEGKEILFILRVQFSQKVVILETVHFSENNNFLCQRFKGPLHNFNAAKWIMIRRFGPIQ